MRFQGGFTACGCDQSSRSPWKPAERRWLSGMEYHGATVYHRQSCRQSFASGLFSFALITEHTPHEEHWHTYAHIHEHTFTQHNRKNIGTYTTHTHSRERVLAGIHHAYNKYTLSHTRYAHNTQKKYKDTNTYSHTSHSHTQKNNTL
jgi:hypothetical protein